jgi:cytochrome oxidase Cu insertion factor (SCO1/SenC/PrrC family)
MQYFQALKLGQKRVAESREYLNKLTDGRAMPALALIDNKSNVWEPVGKENLYAFVDESAGFVLTDNSGYILALVDKTGSSKTIVQGVTKQQKENLEKAFEADNISKFEGKVILPV